MYLFKPGFDSVGLKKRADRGSQPQNRSPVNKNSRSTHTADQGWAAPDCKVDENQKKQQVLMLHNVHTAYKVEIVMKGKKTSNCYKRLAVSTLTPY